MPKKIYKYPLKLEAVQSVKIPRGSILLSAQIQNDSICVWAVVDSEEPMVDAKFAMFATGQKIPTEFTTEFLTFLETLQLRGGELVVHLFLVRSPTDDTFRFVHEGL